jgi:hypothetical protein
MRLPIGYNSGDFGVDVKRRVVLKENIRYKLQVAQSLSRIFSTSVVPVLFSMSQGILFDNGNAGHLFLHKTMIRFDIP